MVRARNVIIAVVTTVAFGAVLAAAAHRTSDTMPEATDQAIGTTTPAPPVPSDGSDPQAPGAQVCLDGLCTSELPAQISQSDAGRYLTQLRAAVEGAPDDGTASKCHLIAHVIGRRVDGGADPLIHLRADDNPCLYGYQHGVLEGQSQRTDTESVLAWVATACDTYRDGREVATGGQLLGTEELRTWRAYALESCVHGVGHAIAVQDLGDIHRTVSYCTQLTAPDEARECAAGVFMAYTMDVPGPDGVDTAPRLTRGEIEDLCHRLERDGASAIAGECWAKLWLIGLRVGVDAVDVAAWCPAGNSMCARGVGEGLYYENSMEASSAIEACPRALGAGCVYGVAWAEANAWVSSGGTREAYRSVCTTQVSAALSLSERDACEQTEAEALEGGSQ